MDFNAELCLERHKQNNKEHDQFIGDIDCLHKKKADKSEVDNVKEWVKTVDARMWGAIIIALLSAVSAVGALATMILQK